MPVTRAPKRNNAVQRFSLPPPDHEASSLAVLLFTGKSADKARHMVLAPVVMRDFLFLHTKGHV
jgi:hypothetical protein